MWPSRNNRPEPVDRPRTGPVLIHALDGFLNAGGAPRIAAEQLARDEGEVVHRFELDDFYDYRARRPFITFREDHYTDYEDPRLEVVRHTDLDGQAYLLLSGPEPDFRWEAFVEELLEVVEDQDVSLTLGLGAVPMGVPHTRPPMITAHGTRPELVDRTNLWKAEVRVPSSMQSLLEWRLAERDLDGAGYVVHVPHYLAQMEFPQAALALLEAVTDRLGLRLDLEELRALQAEAVAQIEEQIAAQDGEDVLSGLEAQYDAFTRGAAQSLLADDSEIPSGEELAQEFEQFLARERKDDGD